MTPLYAGFSLSDECPEMADRCLLRRLFYYSFKWPLLEEAVMKLYHTVFTEQGKSEDRLNPRRKWCRERESNSHSVTRTGF